MKIEDAKELLIKDIKQGKFGNSGTRLPGILTISEEYKIGYVNARKIIEQIKDEGLIMSIGSKNYVCLGQCSTASDLWCEIKDSNRIGVLLHNLTNPYYASLAELLSREIRAINFTPLIITSSDNIDQEYSSLQSIIDEKCIGLISVLNHRNPRIRNLYKSYPIPTVFIGRIDDEIDSSYVTSDNYNASANVARYLYNCKYDKFLYVCTLSAKESIYDDRLEGFKYGLNQVGMTLSDEDIIVFDMNNTVSHYSLVNRIMGLIKDHRVGIFCYHDLIATEIYLLLNRANVSIPQQVGIVGYDGLDISSYFKITTCSYNFKKMAHSAVSLLYDKINGSPNQNICIQTILNVRNTTGSSFD